MTPKIIDGNRIYDDRGSIRFANRLDLKKIKRFYIIHNYSENFIRAWHGHKKEEKYISCIKGTFQISAVKIDNFKKPNKKNKVHTYFLNESNNNFIFIPKGFANGLKSLEENSELLVLSTSSLQESMKDDFRYDANYWNPWEIKYR